MRASDLILQAEDVAVAVVHEPGESESGWMVYLINLKQKELSNILVTSKGYGQINEQSIKTSTLRHFIEKVPAKAYTRIEPIIEDTFALNNEYWVSFYVDNAIYDKRFIFLPDSIIENNFVNIPILNKKGVMIK